MIALDLSLLFLGSAKRRVSQRLSYFSGRLGRGVPTLLTMAAVTFALYGAIENRLEGGVSRGRARHEGEQQRFAFPRRGKSPPQ